jgi:CHAT domain-containing protein
LRQTQLAMLDGKIRIERKNEIDYLRFPDGESIPLQDAKKLTGVAFTDNFLQGFQDEENEFSHPEYWSGIVLIGTPW